MTEPSNMTNVEEAVALLLDSAFPEAREVSSEELHTLICTFLHERQANQAESLRLIGLTQGLLPAMVNIALMQVGLVPFDVDELARLSTEAQRQYEELQERFRQQFGDQP